MLSLARRVLPWALTATVALEIADLAPHPATVLVVAGGLWAVLPGLFLMRALTRAAEPSGLAVWMFGPALGLSFSVFGMFIVWAAGFVGWPAILVGPALTWGIVWLARRCGGPTLRWPRFDRRDVVALVMGAALVPAITWFPYTHVREPVAEGEAYRAYFTADFIWAMTVTAEVARGDVPPANPFLDEQPLHYYWMAHFLSGALYRVAGPLGVTAEQVVLVDGLWFGLSFSAFFYGLTRLAGGGPRASVLAVGAGFLANSYEGADMMRAIVTHGQSWAELTQVNVDAVSRWFYHGMAVDGLQRLLLYQPHHLTGYMVALAAVWLAGRAEDVAEASLPLWAGVLLGLALLFSTFSAVMLGPAFAVVFGLRVIQQRAWRAVPAAIVLGAMPLIVALALSWVLGYTDHRYGFPLEFGLNPVAAHNAPRVLLLSFGPLLLAGIITLCRWRWIARDGAAVAAVMLVTLSFYFLTNVPDSGDVWVGWRAGHMLQITAAAGGAAALTRAWTVRMRRPWLMGAVAIAVAAALPTSLIDVYNAQDVGNRGQGAGFPWTLIITPEEREALEWIRQETAPRAVVQAEPYVRGDKHWAYIPAFAERRAVAGLPVSMTPIRPYREAADDVYWGIYRANSASEAHGMAKFMGIDYLVFGRVERRAYPEMAAEIAAHTELFPLVFRNDEMTIFKVE